MFKKWIALLLTLLIILSGCTNEIENKNSTVKEKINTSTEEKSEVNKELEENLNMILPEYSTEELLEDVDFLINTIEEVHPNSYAYINKETFYKELEKVKSNITKPMNAIEFYKVISPLVSLLKDGHTNVFFPQNKFESYMYFVNGKVFPLIVEIRDNKIFNTKIVNEDISIPIGAEILAINDIKTEEIIKTLKKYETGMRYSYKEVKLEKDLYSLLCLEYKLIDEYKITYKYKDTVDTIITKGVPEYSIDSYLQDRFKYNVNYRYEILDNNICYLDFNSFSDYDSFKSLLDEMFQIIEEKNIETLIIDIRDNGGGKSRLGDLLISYIYDKPFYQFKSIDQKISKQVNGYDAANIGEIVTYEHTSYNTDVTNRFDGKICVLTNRYTFSSATGFSTIIKDFNIGILIGEETGGLATAYGDVYSFKLPNSNLWCGVSYKHFIRPSGDETVKGVVPHYEITQTFEDTINNKDTVLEFTKKYIFDRYDKDYPLLKNNIDIDYIEVTNDDKKQLTNILQKFWCGIFDNNYDNIHETCSDKGKEVFTKDLIDEANSLLLKQFGEFKKVSISKAIARKKDNKINSYFVEAKIIFEKGTMSYRITFNNSKKIDELCRH